MQAQHQRRSLNQDEGVFVVFFNSSYAFNKIEAEPFWYYFFCDFCVCCCIVFLFSDWSQGGDGGDLFMVYFFMNCYYNIIRYAKTVV